jgi:hypothetical protein
MEATLSGHKEVQPDDAVHCTQGDFRNGNKRCKQRPPGTVTIATAIHGDDNGWEVGSFGMGHTSAAACSVRR